MITTFNSNRLTITKLTLDDSEFIFELVNTPDWLKFVGDRMADTMQRAEIFVQSVLDSVNVNYWVVRIKDQHVPIGIVSLVKRDFLEFPDVGFAFLPHHTKKGFAYEAALALLQQLAKENSFSKILANTIKENLNSIALLKKLGFEFNQQIKVDGEELLIYEASIDKFRVE